MRRGAGPCLLLLVGPWLLLVLLPIPAAAALITLLLILALRFVLVALAIGVVASPYLLVRAVHRRVARRLAERRQADLVFESAGAGRFSLDARLER